VIERYGRRTVGVKIACARSGLQLRIQDLVTHRDKGWLVMTEPRRGLALIMPESEPEPGDLVSVGVPPAKVMASQPLPEPSMSEHREAYLIAPEDLSRAVLVPRGEEDQGGVPSIRASDGQGALLKLEVLNRSLQPGSLMERGEWVRVEVAVPRSRLSGLIIASLGGAIATAGVGLLGARAAGRFSRDGWFPDEFFVLVGGSLLTAGGGVLLVTGSILLIADAANPHPAETSAEHPLLSNPPRASALHFGPVLNPNGGGMVLSGRF
jgi:hypothetical protein